MIYHSLALGLIGLSPLFYFGMVKKTTVPTVLFAIFLMQVQNAIYIFDFYPDLSIIFLSLLGVISVGLSLKMVDTIDRDI